MKNILLVEEDKIAAIEIRKKLEILHYNVVAVVQSGENAISAVKRYNPDLVLMDIILKGSMDGIHSARIIKSQTDIPIIFLITSTDNDSIEKAKLIEHFGYILKPFDSIQIKTAVELSLYKRKIENNLKQNDIWHKAALKCIADGVITTDSNGVINFINDKAAEIIGVELNDCTGKSLQGIYEVVEDSSVESILSSLFDDQNASSEFIKNKILRTKTNISIPVEETVSDIKDESGIQIGQVITFKDITQKRKAESSALLSKNIYLKMFEDSPALIWRTNSKGEFNYFNKTWLTFTGKSLEQEIYFGWMKRLKSEDKNNFLNILKNSLLLKESFQVEFEIQDNKNDFRWLLCVANPFYNIEGEFEGLIGTCLEITNRKRMERELITAKQDAESANNVKTRFISNMSHELRTPLNGIMGLTNILSETKLDNEQKEYITLIDQSSKNLLAVLNNLLDFANFESGTARKQNTEFRLVAIINDINKMYSGTSQKKNILFKTELNESPKLKLIGDYNSFLQIINNLLSNAFKFTDTGSVSLNLTAEKDKLNDEYIVVHTIVKDTGIGIPSDMKDIIFESFTQVDGSRTRKYSGTGIGLTITKFIVDMLKGKIWFTSELNMGSEFHVVIRFDAGILN